jgi:hypothetical protein
MISTGTLMLLKALLTASVLLGLCAWQLLVLRRLRREREARKRAESPGDRPEQASTKTPKNQGPRHAPR